MSAGAGVNDTMVRFGYPKALVAEYERWVVMLREQQVTLGALVLICREPATAFSRISAAAFGELATATRSIETALARAFAYEKINYLMLMMVDPHVHFHVVPRYGGVREFAGVSFADPGWPRVPDLSHAVGLAGPVRARLLTLMREKWPDRRAIR